MESIRLVARNGEAVRQALERGEVLHLDTASEEITDEFLLFAIQSGLLRQWAGGFPDSRNWADITCEVILASEIAARFASIYSQLKTGYVLRSARVLGALGYSVEVLEQGAGLSGQGTPEDQLYSRDVLRKLLGKAEKQVDVMKEDRAAGGQGGAEVKVRNRASRRAVKMPESWMKLRLRHVLRQSGEDCLIGTTGPSGQAYWNMHKAGLVDASTFWTGRRCWWSWSAGSMNAAA